MKFDIVDQLLICLVDQPRNVREACLNGGVRFLIEDLPASTRNPICFGSFPRAFAHIGDRIGPIISAIDQEMILAPRGVRALNNVAGYDEVTR